MSDSRRSRRWWVLGLLVAGIACGDTARPLGVAGLDALSVLFIVESPDSIQPLLLMPATPGLALAGLEVEVRGDAGALVATTMLSTDLGDDELRPCQRRYGAVISVGTPRCAVLDWAPDPGGVYRVEITVPDLPTARGEVAVPAEYGLLSLEADYDRSNVRHIDMGWSESAGAYRYHAMIQPATLPTCFMQNACRNKGWIHVTERMHVDEDIPGEALEGARGPWTVTVLAVSEPLHRALTSGASEGLFPVAPASNVEGGHGVMGAWVRVSATLP